MGDPCRCYWQDRCAHVARNRVQSSRIHRRRTAPQPARRTTEESSRPYRKTSRREEGRGIMKTIDDRIAALEEDIGDLIEQSNRKEVRDFTKYADDPVGFNREILKRTLWGKQVE